MGIGNEVQRIREEVFFVSERAGAVTRRVDGPGFASTRRARVQEPKVIGTCSVCEGEIVIFSEVKPDGFYLVPMVGGPVGRNSSVSRSKVEVKCCCRGCGLTYDEGYVRKNTKKD